ncbi:MAG: phosphotriesterase-related protein [Chloroflexota bacterium]|nr:phosphotriesterase-related protein [Chloroflexota bacterium]
MIRTVLGDIAPDQLGICLPHEHLLARPPAPYDADDPDLVLDDPDAAAAELVDWRAAGGGALVEMTPIDYHRDAAGVRALSERTGVHLVCITGYLKEKFSKPFIENETVESLAARMIREINDGIDATGVRAGAIKAASSLNAITPLEARVFQAAARAQRATGALITTHTEAGTAALDQIALLTGAGVPPDRILIGHLDRHMDWGYHQQIAATGVYMGFDQIGKAKYAPDADRAAMIARLIDTGHVAQLMLSMDIARRSSFRHDGGSPGFVHLLTDFVPTLRAANVREDAIRTMIRDNPARAFNLS